MKQNLRLIFMTLLCAVFSTAWGQNSQVLFHETFGNNTGSVRDWDDSYSVKSGVEAVYSGITGYTVTNAGQSKNTAGYDGTSGLTQRSKDYDASIVIGPLNVANYNNLMLFYKWKAGSIKETYYTKAYFATSVSGDYTELTGSGAGATSFVQCDYSLPTTAQVSTLYLKIVFRTSNTQAVIDEVELTGVSSSTTVAAPTFSPITGTTFYGSQTVTISTETQDAAIYYTTNGDEPSTSSTLYTAPFSISATTTIKAIAVKDGMTDSSVAEATYTKGTPFISVASPNINVVSAGGDGTIDVTYGGIVESDLIVCDADGNAATYDWLDAELNSDNNINYLVEKNASSSQRTAYLKVYGLDSETNDVYSDLITITQVAPANLTITPNEKVDIFVFDNADPSETIENGSGVPAGTTVLLSLDVHGGYEFKSLSVISEDNTTIDLTEDPEDHSFTFTMPQSNVTVSCLVYPNNLVKSQKYVKVTSQDQLTSGTYLIVYEAGNLAFNGGLQSLDASGNSVNVTITNQEIARTTTINAATFTYDETEKTLRSASGYYIGNTRSSNGLETSQTVKYTNTIVINNGNATITSKGGPQLQYYATNSEGGNRFRYYTSTQKPVQLYKLVDIEAIDVPITSVGYSSLYYCTLNLKVPAGVTAYTYKANGEKMVVSKTYGTNAVIPAGTGVVLKGDEGTYTFNITSESGVGDEDNALLGLDVEGTTVAPANDGDYFFYKLSTNSNGDASTVGFWLGAQDGGAFTLPAHKAYLAIKQSETPVSSFIFDETVGISSIAAQVNHADGVYTLSGVRVNGDNLPKGIYIMNGKKVVIK